MKVEVDVQFTAGRLVSISRALNHKPPATSAIHVSGAAAASALAAGIRA